ncbi:hypothetical protein MNBD_GAMMA12-2921 [hydrothermal vent metagenome]|uniref:Lipoprotein n=1 Tax=hydrothermal vent metagenome TaxID=652676 RepID=A0A3B0ZCE5_9ZZZZ
MNCRIIKIIAISLVISSCGGLNVKPNFIFKAGTKLGIVIFSDSENCPANLSVIVSKVGKTQPLIYMAIDYRKAVSRTVLAFGDSCGRVFVSSLKAGKYEFLGFQTAGGHGVNYHGSMKIRFDVTAGKVTYLGYFNFATHYGDRVFGVIVKDRRIRDIPLFRKHVPSLKNSSVFFQVNKYRGTNLRIKRYVNAIGPVYITIPNFQ